MAAASGTTNNQLNITLVRLEGKLDLINADLGVVKEMATKNNIALYGNGKLGVLDNHRELKRCFDEHTEEHRKTLEEIKNKRDKFSIRTWAIVMLFISQLVALLFLYMRPPV